MTWRCCTGVHSQPYRLCDAASAESALVEVAVAARQGQTKVRPLNNYGPQPRPARLDTSWLAGSATWVLAGDSPNCYVKFWTGNASCRLWIPDYEPVCDVIVPLHEKPQ
jgi:hypothetical protein